MARDFNVWFPEWCLWIQATIPRGDWPDPGSPFWGEFQRRMAQERLTEAEAAKVGRSFFEAPFGRMDAFPGEFGKRLRSLRGERLRKAREDQERPTAAQDMTDAEHQRMCESVWATLSEPERDEWREKAMARFPFLRRGAEMTTTMAMAMAAGEFDYPPPDSPRGLLGVADALKLDPAPTATLGGTDPTATPGTGDAAE